MHCFFPMHAPCMGKKQATTHVSPNHMNAVHVHMGYYLLLAVYSMYAPDLTSHAVLYFINR